MNETVIVPLIVALSAFGGVLLGASITWRMTRGLPPIPELPRRIRISGGDDETTKGDDQPPKARL
jgi:hypothetical protein